MDSRSRDTRKLVDADRTVPELCAVTGDSVSDGATSVQGRGARSQSGQRGVGFMLCGQETI